jgi:xanthine dehydrogenase accessory factor
MAKDIYEEIVRLRLEGACAALATIIAHKGATPRKDSAKMLVYEDGRQSGSIGGGAVEAEVCLKAKQALETKTPCLLTFDLTDIDPDESALVCGGSMDVYIEPIFPEPTLIIFGAGHIGKAIADAGKIAGFKIAVVDDRAKYANPERFPTADAFYVDSWDEALQKLRINASSYLFIATRGHQFDLMCLRLALSSSAKYIGMLGSRKKSKILFDLLEKEGVHPSDFERVLVPAGFDIGSETPEEIAASIVVELIAVSKNRDIRSMRDAVRRGTQCVEGRSAPHRRSAP